jgi:hypothetical protein
LISIYLATRPNLQETYEWLWRGVEFNPPLNHLLMRAYISCFGTDEVIVRLPSLFWGILLVPALYWLGVTLHSRKAGLLAALFAALAPQANYFACQTRPYSISTLFNCLCMIYFCRLLDSERQNKKLDLFFFILLMTLFCYSSTFGVFSLAALVVAYAVLWLARLRAPSTDTLSLAYFAPAFAVPAILFAPWLPAMLHQAKIIKPVDPCKLAELPWALGVCLTTMLPLPLLLAIWVAVLCAVLALALLLFSAFEGRLSGQMAKLCQTVLTTPGYVVLLVMTLLPSALMGVFAGVWLGYFRYIYPFSPAEWMLLALVIVGRDDRASQPEADVEVSTNSAGIGKKFWRPLLSAFALFAFILVNVAYILWFDQRSQSGLKLVAQAIRDGKFDNSVIMLAPDLPGPTLYYYSKESERAAHHVLISGFVREHPDTPTIGDVMSEQWSSKTVVDEYVAKIATYAQQGYQYLAFAQDSMIYGTDQIPLKPRVQELFEKLKSKYKIVNTESYPGLTETMNVSFFKL